MARRPPDDRQLLLRQEDRKLHPHDRRTKVRRTSRHRRTSGLRKTDPGRERPLLGVSCSAGNLSRDKRRSRGRMSEVQRTSARRRSTSGQDRRQQDEKSFRFSHQKRTRFSSSD